MIKEKVVHQSFTATYIVSTVERQTATGTKRYEKVWDVYVDPYNVWYDITNKEEDVEE